MGEKGETVIIAQSPYLEGKPLTRKNPIILAKQFEDLRQTGCGWLWLAVKKAPVSQPSHKHILRTNHPEPPVGSQVDDPRHIP